MREPFLGFVPLPAIAVLLFPLAACSPKPSEPPRPPVVSGLAISRAAWGQAPAGASAVGTLSAKESAVLSAQITARVLSVPVHEGDSVRAGQVLIRLDDTAARSEVARAQAAIAASQHQVEVAQTQSALAASTLARYRILRDKKSVSPQEFDEVERRAQAGLAQLQAAQSELAAARATAAGAGAAAGYSILAAPFAGIIVARHVDPGALATPGSPLLEIDRSGALQLCVSLDESLLRELQPGSAIEARVPAASPQPLKGRIAEILPAADPASRSFLVKIDLPASSALRAGMYGTASIGSSNRSALMIPQSAVVSHGSLESVWVVDNHQVASLRYVSLGARFDQSIEVLSGLSAGELVVLSPGDRELGGSRIEVRP